MRVAQPFFNLYVSPPPSPKKICGVSARAHAPPSRAPPRWRCATTKAKLVDLATFTMVTYALERTSMPTRSAACASVAPL